MPRRKRDEDDWDDWDESGDYDAYRDYDPEDTETYPEGLYDDDGPPLVACRYCREEIAEEAERCPHCGNYQSREEAPPGERKSGAWVILMILALLAAASWALGG